MMQWFASINPCHYKSKLQYSLEWLTYGTECRCYIGFRIVFAFLLGLTIGYAL